MQASGHLDATPVETVDGDLMSASEARAIARRYHMAGFFLLPWIWAVNCWLFWPHFTGRGPLVDPIIQNYTRKSGWGLAVYTSLLLPWMLVYWIGGADVLGEATYRELDVTELDLASAGLATA